MKRRSFLGLCGLALTTPVIAKVDFSAIEFPVPKPTPVLADAAVVEWGDIVSVPGRFPPIASRSAQSEACL